MKYILTSLLIFCVSIGFSQDYTYHTFKDGRIINSHSVETLRARNLEFRISHRFGDFAGQSGGWETFYGLENAQDILIGFDYGITDNISFAIQRTKGSGPLKRNLNGILKVRAIRQSSKGSPVTITAVATTSYSTMKKVDNPEAINNFPKNSHRLAYNGQILIARKFGETFSLQIHPGYTYRNLVPFNDENGIFSIGGAMRLQLNKVWGIIADFTIPFSDLRTTENRYYFPLGIGLEWETGGHVFQVSFTNAQGIMETDYIPYTQSNWGDGQYRLGFTISRIFNL